jgi:hypothetical protein
LSTISVAKRFALQVRPGQIVHIFPGVQDVSDEIADHWYTKLHLTKLVAKPAPKVEAPAPIVEDDEPVTVDEEFFTDEEIPSPKRGKAKK